MIITATQIRVQARARQVRPSVSAQSVRLIVRAQQVRPSVSARRSA